MRHAVAILCASMAVSLSKAFDEPDMFPRGLDELHIFYRDADELDMFSRDFDELDISSRDLDGPEAIEAYGLGLLHRRSVFEGEPVLVARAGWTMKSAQRRLKEAESEERNQRRLAQKMERDLVSLRQKVRDARNAWQRARDRREKEKTLRDLQRAEGDLRMAEFKIQGVRKAVEQIQNEIRSITNQIAHCRALVQQGYPLETAEQIIGSGR